MTYDSMITSERVSRVELGSFDIATLTVVSRSQVCGGDILKQVKPEALLDYI